MEKFFFLNQINIIKSVLMAIEISRQLKNTFNNKFTIINLLKKGPPKSKVEKKELILIILFMSSKLKQI